MKTPDFSEKTQTEVVRTGHMIIWTDQDCPTGKFKEGGEEAVRGNDGRTTPKSGLASNGTSYYGKPRAAGSKGCWL